MDRILERHDDVGTVGYIIYTNGSRFACADKACTVRVSMSKLKEAFLKGCVIVDVESEDGLCCKPTGYFETVSNAGDGYKKKCYITYRSPTSYSASGGASISISYSDAHIVSYD